MRCGVGRVDGRTTAGTPTIRTEMGGIFINYRRGRGHARFVREFRGRLVDFFGEGQVFLDEPAIDVGEDFRRALEKRLADAEVVIAVIHPEWVADLDREGKDWVREELELGLRDEKKLVPLLLDGVTMPTAAALPESIRELAYRQAHKVHDTASWKDDVEALIGDLERDVASWDRGEPEGFEPTPPRGWVGYLAAVLALVALVAPAWFLPDLTSARELAVDLSLLMLVLMLAPLAAISMMSMFQRPVALAEERVHDIPLGTYYLRVAAPLGLLGVVLIASMILSLPVAPEVIPVLIFIIVIATVFLVVLIREQRKKEERRENEWPQRVPEPVRAAPVRQELARLERKIKEWPRHRPTRDLCLRAASQLRHLQAAGAVLSEHAARGRWRWLLAEHPWVVSFFAVWMAGSVGLMAAAALPRLAIWPPVIVAAFACGVAAATTEVAYRRQCRQLGKVAQEVHDHACRIEQQLRDLRSRRG